MSAGARAAARGDARGAGRALRWRQAARGVRANGARQGSANKVITDLNEAMRKNENKYKGAPFVWSGLGDNPQN